MCRDNINNVRNMYRDNNNNVRNMCRVYTNKVRNVCIQQNYIKDKNKENDSYYLNLSFRTMQTTIQDKLIYQNWTLR